MRQGRTWAVFEEEEETLDHFGDRKKEDYLQGYGNLIWTWFQFQSRHSRHVRLFKQPESVEKLVI